MAFFGNLDPLTPTERAWLAYVAKTLGLRKPPAIAVDAPHTADIAYAGAMDGSGNGTILLGTRFLAHRAGTEIRLRKLAHESLHAAGWHHDDTARRLGYHSKPERDRFSIQFTKRLLHGWNEVSFHG